MSTFRKNLIIGIIACLLGIFWIYSLSSGKSSKGDPHPLIGQKAPDLIVKKLDGTELSLSSLIKDKKAVVIDFWATWCGPCTKALPALEKVASRYNPDEVMFIGINVWDGNVNAIKNFIEKNKITHVNIFVEKDVEETRNKFVFNSIPSIFVLDNEMNIRNYFEGYDSTVDALIKSAIDNI